MGTSRRKKNKLKSRFYNIGEDKEILKTLDKVDKTKTEIAQILSKKLGRTVESIRDRMKRYLEKITNADKKKIIKSKQNYKYAYFEKGTNNVKLKCFDEIAPSVYERVDLKRTIKVKKKKKITKKTKTRKPRRKFDKTKNYNRDFVWLLKKLKDDDVKSKEEVGYAFIKSFIACLEDKYDVGLDQIIKALSSIKHNFNLGVFFKKLKIKQIRLKKA